MRNWEWHQWSWSLQRVCAADKQCINCGYYTRDTSYNAGGYCNYHRTSMSPWDYCGYWR
jgi:hypothetical protein